MRKICGIPLFLIAILIGAGIAVATFTYVYKLDPTIQRPTTEQANVSFTVVAGEQFTEHKWLELALPAKYDLTYKLTGDDSDHLKDESATISLDLNGDGDVTDEGESSLTITRIGGTVTFHDVAAGQINQWVSVSATARDGVLVGTTYASGDQNPAFDTVDVVLQVKMVPTKA